MTTTTSRASERWTKGLKKVATVLAVGGLALTTVMIGGVAFAPAASACPPGCSELCRPVTVTVPLEAQICTAAGVTETIHWTGEGSSSYGPFQTCPGNGTIERCEFGAGGYADALDAATAEARNDTSGRVLPSGATLGACTFSCKDVPKRVDDDGLYCTDKGTETLAWWGEGSSDYAVLDPKGVTDPRCSAESESAASAAALAEAQKNADIMKAEITRNATEGACAVTVSWVGEAATSGSAEYCTVEGTTVTLAYSGVGRSSSTTSQADATYQAQLIADREAQADLLSVTPTGATPGACPAPEAVEPATVAPVLPATVPVEEPAAVAVPAPATVQVPAAAPLPASIPAGDGSSVPQQPVALLALLALAAAVAVTSGLRMATNR